ncbi:MAG: SdrD B-like domain-containing protein [Chloroflexota bacterium]
MSGTAWLDTNINGIIDDGEPGIGGITVVGQDETGVILETMTADNGTWSLAPFDGQRVFIQYKLPDDGPLSLYLPSLAGAYTVRTLSIGPESIDADAGYFDPNGFCAANPELVISQYTVGNSAGAGLSNFGPIGAAYSFQYEISGGEDSSDYRQPNLITPLTDVGAIWGLAWDEAAKKLYQSAVVKRHTGMGPLGIGGIYITDLSLGSETSEFIDLAAAGVNVGSLSERDLPSDPTGKSRDPEAFAAAGKIGIGGIDLSPDGQTLFAVNLAEKTLVSIETATATVISQTPIPEAECTSGETRPFAVKVADSGDVFVGAVCSAENDGTAEDLSAHVFKLLGDQFESVISFPIGTLERGQLTGSLISGDWLPWSDEWIKIVDSFEQDGEIVEEERTEGATPVPMLTDLEFDDDGSLILALSDRTGFNTGKEQLKPFDTSDEKLYSRSVGGDIMRACLIEDGFVIEGQDGCPLNRTEGFGGFEYYVGEQYDANFETALGAVALLPGSGEVVATVSTPLIATNGLTGGVRWLDNLTGETRRGYQITRGNDSFGVSQSLGDVEVICRPAPQDVGSRVWRDINNNGVYDAGDSALPNVPIELFNVKTNEVIASAVSDTNGRFGFSTSTIPGSPSFATGIVISPGESYQLRTPIDQGAIAGLTVISEDESIQSVLTNDAVIAERRAVINFVPDQEKDLTQLDFGFVLQAQASAAEGDDSLQPGSNVVGAEDVQTGEQAQSNERQILGVPIDPTNRLFLAVTGLMCIGLLAILLGSGGLFWTYLSIRKYRLEAAVDSPSSDPEPESSE